MKKILAVILLLAVMLSVIATAALAEDDENHQNAEDDSEHENNLNNTEQIEVEYENETEYEDTEQQMELENETTPEVEDEQEENLTEPQEMDYNIQIDGASQEDLQLVSEDTTREIRVMNEMTGAKLRMLQLERAARVNFAKAKAVMAYINTTYPDQDITALQEIMNSMTALAEEAKNYNPQEHDLKENIDKFVEWKKQGLELTATFREESNKILTEEDKTKIRARFTEIEQKASEMLQQKIQTQLKAHNTQVVQNAIQRLGVNDTEIIAKVQSGEITPEQIKNRIQTEYNSLSEEQKVEIKTKLQEQAQEERNKRLEFIKEAAKKEIEIAKKLQEIQKENIQERLNFFEQRREQIREDVVGDARSRAMAMSFNGNGQGGFGGNGYSPNGQYAYYNGNGGMRR